MRHLLIACAFMLPLHANAGSNAQGPHGGIAAARGLAASHASANVSHGNNGSNGNGGSYWSPDPNSSLVDAYQPWPEAEMRRFQKP